MKKTVLTIIASIAVASSMFANEINLSFENKISSDVVSISDGGTEFAGIKEQITAEVETEKVDIGVSLITYLNKTENGNVGFTDFEFDKAYVEFRPINFLSLDFNRKVFTEGSYLPIEDDNIANGNIAGDFSVIVKPLENLSIAAGIKIPSIFADEKDKYDFDAGVDYSTDLFSVGATLRNPVNNLGFGIFGSFKGVEDLQVNLGFTYNDEFKDVKGNLITLGAVYNLSIFTFSLDFVSSFGNEGNDLYTALCLETEITENLILETQATLNMDYEVSNSTEVIAEVGAAYVNGNHKVRAGVAVDIKDTVGVSFPVYYKYSF